MKYYIDGLLIVEGKSDLAFLKSFLDVEIITTNGFDIPRDEIEYVLRVSQTKKIIIMSDPDAAGTLIRKRLNELIPNAFNALVDISKCDKNNKHGVAECQKEEVISVLKPYFSLEKPKTRKISIENLIEFGLTGDFDSKSRRENLCKKLKLGKCNFKTMLNRINFLQIDIQEIKEALNHGNK